MRGPRAPGRLAAAAEAGGWLAAVSMGVRPGLAMVRPGRWWGRGKRGQERVRVGFERGRRGRVFSPYGLRPGRVPEPTVPEPGRIQERRAVSRGRDGGSSVLGTLLSCDGERYL